jgi:hypothetical protein
MANTQDSDEQYWENSRGYSLMSQLKLDCLYERHNRMPRARRVFM